MLSADGKRFALATAALVGTLLGVGMFGVPYAIGQVGLVLALVYFVFLGGSQMLQSLFFAEAAIACDERFRLAGLARKYLGKRVGYVAAAASILGFWGAIIAYILVGGTFLHMLLSPVLGGEPFHYQLIWGVLGAAAIYFGMGFVEKINFVATVALAVTLLLIIGLAVPHVRVDNLLAQVSGGDLFLPYGVILFALAGASSIPEMEDIMAGKHRGFRKAVIVGMLIAIVITALFGFAVYGVTGQATTEDALSGLQVAMGNGITVLAAVVGFLAIATSYFIMGLSLRETFEYDYRMHVVPAWLLAVGAPIAIVLLGASDFIQVIGFTGAVFGGVTAVVVSLLYIAVTKRGLVKEKKLGVPLIWANVTIVVMSLGALYEMFSTLKEMI